MGIISIILLGIGLSMDALAVSIADGITIKNLKLWHCLKIGIFFGVFQAIMPILGYLGGTYIKQYIESFDHWVAFALLSIIGGKMLYDSFKKDKDEDCENYSCPSKTKNLLVMAFATSIDALAVGITLAVEHSNILMSAAIIGTITFTISFLGVLLGKELGKLFEKRATIIGGLVLIGIGIEILVEHLFFQ